MNIDTQKKRIVVGISGASGTPLALRLLQMLSSVNTVETHVVMTNGARLTAQYELPNYEEQLLPLADEVHDLNSLGSSIASGTFKTAGMVIIPCSMKTVAGIASGYSDNLLLRAADVTIKEQRPLVLVARETPLSPIHLKNLSYVATLPNITVMPPMLTYYNKPESIEDMEHHLVAKILERFDIEVPNFKRWQE